MIWGLMAEPRAGSPPPAALEEGEDCPPGLVSGAENELEAAGSHSSPPSLISAASSGSSDGASPDGAPAASRPPAHPLASTATCCCVASYTLPAQPLREGEGASTCFLHAACRG